MMIAPHAVTGSAIGELINNPIIVFILAIASHFILDALPHYDIGVMNNYAKNIKFGAREWIFFVGDGIIGLLLTWWLYEISGYNWLVLLGAFAGILPDIVDDIFRVSFKDGKLYFDFQKKIPVISQMHEFHERIHFKLKPKYWYWGVTVQIVVMGLSIMVFYI